MEQETPVGTSYEDNTKGQEAPPPSPASHNAMSEPDETGGDSPCWAHMLDEEGRIIDRPQGDIPRL